MSLNRYNIATQYIAILRFIHPDTAAEWGWVRTVMLCVPKHWQRAICNVPAPLLHPELPKLISHQHPQPVTAITLQHRCFREFFKPEIWLTNGKTYKNNRRLWWPHTPMKKEFRKPKYPLQSPSQESIIHMTCSRGHNSLNSFCQIKPLTKANYYLVPGHSRGPLGGFFPSVKPQNSCLH